jgi:hypothetical protein
MKNGSLSEKWKITRFACNTNSELLYEHRDLFELRVIGGLHKLEDCHFGRA